MHYNSHPHLISHEPFCPQVYHFYQVNMQSKHIKAQWKDTEHAEAETPVETWARLRKQHKAFRERIPSPTLHDPTHLF